MSLKYKFKFSKEAEKNIKRLDKPTIIRILNSIEDVIESPKSHPNVKKMKGYVGEVFRLRVGEFRVLYEVIEDELLIFIFRIGSRGDVYK